MGQKINQLSNIKLRIHIKSNGSASGILPRVIFAPDHIRIMARTTRSRQHDLQFSIRNKVLFQLHDTTMKFRTRTRIAFRMKTAMTCMGTKFRLDIR